MDNDDGDDYMGHVEDVKVEQVMCELDMEIVLDSEDEESCRTETITLFNCRKVTGGSEKNVSKKREGQSPCVDVDSIDKQLSAGTKRSSMDHDRSDGKKDVPQLSIGDHEIRRLEYVDSQEPGESSQAIALCFVDNFLSFNSVDLCQGVEERTRTKSPLVSSAKGTRHLAKIINRGSPVKEVGTFEWFESCHQGETDSFSKRMTGASEFGDLSHQDLHNKGQRSLSNEHEEEHASRHSLSGFKDQGLKASIGIEKESEGNMVNGSFKEVDELMKTKSSSEKFEASGTARDIPDMFDVGFSTQIAAEAMEALCYGLPCKACDTCEAVEGALTDLLEGEAMSRTHLVHHSLQKVAACEIGEVGKESIRRKRSARRYNKNISSSSWNCNYQEFSHKLKPETSKSKQSKLDESVSQNNLENCETYMTAFIPDMQNLCRKQLSQEEHIIHQTRHCKGGANVKKIKDQMEKPRVMTNNVEGSILTYKRKRKSVVANPPKSLSGKQKCAKLHSYASAETLDGKLSEQRSSPQEAAIARYLRLDTWNCPKGKRTQRKVPIHSSGKSNMHASFTSVGAEEHKLDPVRNKKMPEDDETNSSNFNMKGRMCTSLSWPSLESNSDESLSRQNCKEQVSGVTTNSDLAAPNIRESAWDLDGVNAAQTEKPYYVDSTSIINGLKNHNFGEPLRNTIEPSGKECITTLCCKKSVNEASLNNRPYVYHRKPCNKNLPKPSLLKELIGLGVPKLMSDFTHRGFRARKELAYIRVLFSQHLDDDVVKQQKKIAARLGICITSCSLDATHFIADKFVRTRNMLEAIALGKSVVTNLWLDSCGQASCLLDERNYILRDSKREKEIGFNMAVSLARARRYPLLKVVDRRICITQSVKPNKEMIASLAKAVGGEVVEAKDQKIPDDLLILSCEQDLAICKPLFEKGINSSQRGIDMIKAQGNIDLCTCRQEGRGPILNSQVKMSTTWGPL
ncbi:hypothetical protein Golob_012806 [Gossypium lobatum]|uniref:BRCT domain-containing protein n=1 Tax=Gossypium lobatum TaxID=34289 RepID=A0A7J8LMU6_9ROSI|nr:hypothetical protein [Gossypium lobatum]